MLWQAACLFDYRLYYFEPCLGIRSFALRGAETLVQHHLPESMRMLLISTIIDNTLEIGE